MVKKKTVRGTGENPARQVLLRLEREYPEAGTRLKFSNLFELVVAVLLSAQTTDEQVNRVTGELFRRFPTPAAMASASLEELEEAIKQVGLFRNKAKHLKELAIMLCEQYDGQVPDDFDELLRLPGIGRKSANVIMAVGWGRPGLGVDTHVHRVANRLGLVSCQARNQTELSLKEQIPPEKWAQAHHLFISHGREVCKSRRPNCDKCVLQDLCHEYRNNQPKP